MSQYAQLPDGTQLEFPDDTRPEVMQAAVKKMLGVPAVPGIPKPMLPPGMMTEQQRASADAAVNAGHDLNLDNLQPFLTGTGEVDEVSIGHALIADALELGYTQTIQAYLAACQPSSAP